MPGNSTATWFCIYILVGRSFLKLAGNTAPRAEERGADSPGAYFLRDRHPGEEAVFSPRAPCSVEELVPGGKTPRRASLLRGVQRCRATGGISSTFASFLSTLPAAAQGHPGESRCAEDVLRTGGSGLPGPPGGLTPTYPTSSPLPSTSMSMQSFQPAAASLPWETLWLGGSSGLICIHLHVQQMEGVVIVWLVSGG